MRTALLRANDHPRLAVHHDVFPFEREVAGRGGLGRAADVVTVEIFDGTDRGRGECVPYARYGETIEEIVDTIERLAPEVEAGLSRKALQRLLPAGAARNALDCALWDLDAKRNASAVWLMIGLETPHRITTAFTIRGDTAAEMAAVAAEQRHRPLFKLEMPWPDALERLAAVRAAAPAARLLLDAAESWDIDTLLRYMPALKRLGVELIEQPLPAGADAELAGMKHEIPIAADESCLDHRDVETLAGRYDAVVVKLDKNGGLTEAVTLIDAARDCGLRIMVSAPPSSALAVAPAVLIAQQADWVDLDAPLLLARDRQPGLRYDASLLYPPSVSLWG